MSSELSFAEVPRSKLAETAAQHILEVVRTQPPGTKLPTERDLMTSLGVGRSTVREALKGLALIGVLEVRHGQGAFVADFAPTLPIGLELQGAATKELIEARQIIEVEIARLAAARRSDEWVAEMNALLTDHRATLKARRRPVLQASRFHVLIAEAAENRVLAAVVRPFFRLMIQGGPAFYELIEGYADWELEQHEQIFGAIRDRDGERAADMMRAHVTAMSSYYETNLEGSAASAPMPMGTNSTLTAS
jgi:GntR family transcriptional regulator, transcriptional repressor for pyruvate dehydrogenase complex